MDFSEIKKYAVQARRDFIEAVSHRASKFGVTKDQVTDYQIKGELLVIGAEAYPRDLKSSIDDLKEAVRLLGFDSAIESFAYTWFNRFVALRYMELQGYLDVRVLSSSSDHPHPDIMQSISSLHFDAPFSQAQALKLYEAGNQDEELYKYLLIAQCNHLNKVMPFLFEEVSDVSELLLPDNLLATDSVIRKLVTEIDEELWRQGVEIIGWIYQYYISEKKDEVIGKVVKSEDIPAATQLFTPNWIVKYLVQNSRNCPDSR